MTRTHFYISQLQAIVPVVHAIQKEPQLERELFGYSFTPEDKANLLKTDNMGRVANLVDKKTGEITPSFISIDKLTRVSSLMFRFLAQKTIVDSIKS